MSSCEYACIPVPLPSLIGFILQNLHGSFGICASFYCVLNSDALTSNTVRSTLSMASTWCRGSISADFGPVTCSNHLFLPPLIIYRTGAISAAEFSDRFFGIFAAVPAQLADELFIQMAFIVPQPNRRLELLRLARNVGVCLLPTGIGRPASCSRSI